MRSFYFETDGDLPLEEAPHSPLDVKKNGISRTIFYARALCARSNSSFFQCRMGRAGTPAPSWPGFLGSASNSKMLKSIFSRSCVRTTSLPLNYAQRLAKALFNKGFRLGALDRSQAAIAVYDELLARFGAAVELPLREQVAKALLNKGFRLDTLDRSQDEVAVYDELLARFGGDTAAGVEPVLKMAHARIAEISRM